MKVVVARGHGRARPTVLTINGEPLLMRDAARKLGLTHGALKQRIQRGSSLARPFQRHSSE